MLRYVHLLGMRSIRNHLLMTSITCMHDAFGKLADAAAQRIS